MILVGYHSARGLKLFDLTNKKIVIIDELKEWDLTKNVNKD